LWGDWEGFAISMVLGIVGVMVLGGVEAWHHGMIHDLSVWNRFE